MSRRRIVLLGTDTYFRQPIIDLRIRKAIRNGARVHILTSEPARLDRLAAGVVRYPAGQTGAVARALLAVLLDEKLARGAYAKAHAGELAARRKQLGTPKAGGAGGGGSAGDAARAGA